LNKRATKQVPTTEAFGLGLLSIPLLCLMWSRPAALQIPLSACVVPGPPRCSPSERARRDGWQYRIQARLAMNQEREALEAWDPAGTLDLDREVWRRQMLLLDRGGHLHRARTAARQAAALARTPGETYRAALLLAYLECDAGDHAAELQQARRMMTLRPHCKASLGALWHAARCNGLPPRARRAMTALRVLEDTPEQVISAREPLEPVTEIGMGTAQRHHRARTRTSTARP
jgi:hypothetical protein